MTTAAFCPCAEPHPSTYWDDRQAAYQLENDPTKVIYMDANEGAKCRKSPPGWWRRRGENAVVTSSRRQSTGDSHPGMSGQAALRPTPHGATSAGVARQGM